MNVCKSVGLSGWLSDAAAAGVLRRGVAISTVINNFTFDGATKDPMQQAVRDALIALMAATFQAQAEPTKAAQRAGIEHAKECGDRELMTLVLERSPYT